MKKIIFYGTLLFVIFLPSLVHGADFYFEPATHNFPTGESQLVLKINTGIDSVNAVGGKIEIPEGVEVSKINTGSSAVLMWIDQPKAGKLITFSGITPGGFRGDVRLFSIGYTTKLEISQVLKVTESEVIKNDDKGTVVPSKSESFRFTLSGQSTSTEEVDGVPPEAFVIALGKEKESFNGSYFASFVAQDKNSGVQKYEWAHTYFFSPREGDWQETQNPIVLGKMVYFQKIFVKATDGEGNERISAVSGPYRYAVLWIGIILMLTVLCVLFFVRPSLYRFS